MRVWWLAVGAVAILGCESLRHTPPLVPQPEILPRPASGGGQPPVITPIGALASPARPVIESSESPPTDSLTLAAECLERGNHAAAADHLEAYVRAHPEQLMFRAQLAEMLVRVGRDDAARVHFERFVAAAQAATGSPKDHLIHSHTRLMEIAQRADDRFGEVFHRGIGLLLLVKQQQHSAERDEAFCEEMLCQSMKALAEAKELKPGDARTRVYLAEVYDHMGNRRGAEVERTAARGGVAAGELTAVERNRLVLRE